ncbi:histidine kinase [Thalassotalea sp. Y01]|uniref:sensor histidine kinase n=1 Tax=Thalassotalea sp. Y01 TaxID=2729613 RepID=UPI00145F15A2|nr:histidine kinase [Thalassotalea sp. Y01]NMP17472.1 sensor histidine kinase [Thalassotalea sp. Y01]
MKKLVTWLSAHHGVMAGVSTVLVIAGISLYWLNDAPIEYKASSYWVMLAFTVYLACFIAIHKSADATQNEPLQVGLLLLMLAAAFAVLLLIPLNFTSILTIIWVAKLSYFLSLARTMLVTTVVIVCWFGLSSYYWNESNVVIQAMLFGCFHLFSILMSYQTQKAERNSLQLQRVNNELLSTQRLLASTSRLNERSRIARDLHDLLGHHLTALSINLQVAELTCDGDAKQRVAECRHLAKLLLSDVREAVNSLKENQQLDFNEMLDSIVAGLPGLQVEKSIETDFHIEEVALARDVLHCSIEAMTNTLRHSGASHFYLKVWRQDDGLHVEMADNGKVHKKLNFGNGLNGIKERVDNAHGQVQFNMDKGLKITMTFPSLFVKAEA